MKYAAAYICQEFGNKDSAELQSFPYDPKNGLNGKDESPNDAFLRSGATGAGIASERFFVGETREEAEQKAETAYHDDKERGPTTLGELSGLAGIQQ